MEEEMKSLRSNSTWVLVLKPEGKKLVQRKWIFKVKKYMSSFDLIRFKTRLVVKSFT